MKRILTLVLCWLIAFTAMAETTFKAKTAASVAGGYVTSLNKVDGSFEDGTAGWIASTDNIVQTASTEFQGNYKGVWAGTGAGTLDLQWTATASNTYEASAQVNVNGEDDVYICAYVGTTETGCKLIPALSKIQKVSVIADSIISSAFYLRLKHTGSDAFSVDVDDGKIEPWTAQAVNLEIKESITYTGYTSGTTSGIKFATKSTRSNNNYLLTSDNSGTYTKISFLKYSQIHAVFKTLPTITTSTSYIRHYDSSGTLIEEFSVGRTSVVGMNVPYIATANTGDYILAASSDTQNSGITFTVSATAISDNVVQSWQDGTEWKALTYQEVNALSGNQGLGTFTAGGVEWKRDGGDLLYKGKLTIGTVTASEARLPLPSGLLSAGTSVIPSIQLAGKLNFDQVSTTYFSGATILVEPSVGYITIGGESSARNGLSKVLGTFFTPGNTVSFNARIPIAGWSSTPTLLALPTSKENVFRVSINPNTNTVTSDPSSIVSSVSQSGGIVTINLKSSALTASPIVTSNYQWIGNNDIYSRVESASSSVIRVAMLNAGVYRVPSDDTILDVIIAKGADYTAPGVFISNLNPDGFSKADNVAGLVKFASYTFSGSASTLNECTSTPCAEFSKIGSGISSITRSGLGLYAVIFDKTYTQINCNYTFVAPTTGYGIVPANVATMSGKNVSTLNASTWRASGESYQNAAGTINCYMKE